MTRYKRAFNVEETLQSFLEGRKRVLESHGDEVALKSHRRMLGACDRTRSGHSAVRFIAAKGVKPARLTRFHLCAPSIERANER